MAQEHFQQPSPRQSHYTPSHPYHSFASTTHPIPSAPMLVLEPARSDPTTGLLHFTCRPYTLHSPVLGPPKFLHHLSLTPLAPVPYISSKQEWSYKSRHTAQLIPPCFYLGPAGVAKDVEWLRVNGVSMIVSVRSASLAAKFPRLMDPKGFESVKALRVETRTFDVDGPFEIITKLREVLRGLGEHLAETAEWEIDDKGSTMERVNVKGRVLVVCESGNERSPVLIAAWIMLVYGISWSEALNMIHAFRFSVCLNGGMNDMLRTWEEVLKAEFDADAASRNRNRDENGNSDGQVGMNGKEIRNSNPNSTMAEGVKRKNLKRSLDQSYDSDETMADETEWDSRPGLAPFVDNR